MIRQGPIQRMIEVLRNGAWKQGWGSPQGARLSAQGLEEVLRLLQAERAALRGNLLLNSHFEIFERGITREPIGWTADLWNDNPVRSDNNRSGGNSIRFRGTVVSGSGPSTVTPPPMISEVFPVNEDIPYRFGAYLSATGGTFGTFGVRVRWYESDGTTEISDNSFTVTTATTGFEERSLVVDPPANARYARMDLEWAGNLLDNVYVDYVFMHEAPLAFRVYTDTAFVIGNAITVPVEWDMAEYDHGGHFDFVQFGFVAPRDMRLSVSSRIGTFNVSTRRFMQYAVNGARYARVYDEVGTHRDWGGATDIVLSTGDLLTVDVRQESGVTQPTSTDPTLCFFEGHESSRRTT